MYRRHRATLTGSVRGMTASLVFSLVGTVLAGCGLSHGPEEAVRLWISEAEAAAENRDHGALMAMIAESYADARGNDKADIGQVLRIGFLRNRNIVLASKIDDVTVTGETAARVRLRTGIAGAGDGVLDVSAEALRIELELASDGDEWRLIGARWGEIGGELR